MNKAELIEAINATIAPNGVKGITAESLANILIEIVNAAGEGGGGVGSEYIDMTTENMETMEPTADAKAHNAELYNKILSIASSNGAAAFPVISLGGGMLGPYALYSKAIVFGEGYIDFIFPTSTDPTIYDVVMVIGSSLTTGAESAAVVGSWGMDIPLRMTPDGNVAILLGL